MGFWEQFESTTKDNELESPSESIINTTELISTIKQSIYQNIVKNIVHDRVIPQRGSIVYCTMWGVEHTGVYIGNNQIVDLNGNGKIQIQSIKSFLEGTNALVIYVACDGFEPLYLDSIADNALNQVGLTREYNFLMENCHKFTSCCITGDFDNDNILNTFMSLEELIQKTFVVEEFTWKIWDLDNIELF